MRTPWRSNNKPTPKKERQQRHGISNPLSSPSARSRGVLQKALHRERFGIVNEPLCFFRVQKLPKLLPLGNRRYLEEFWCLEHVLPVKPSYRFWHSASTSRPSPSHDVTASVVACSTAVFSSGGPPPRHQPRSRVFSSSVVDDRGLQWSLTTHFVRPLSANRIQSLRLFRCILKDHLRGHAPRV
jgi:hypothetical protein